VGIPVAVCAVAGVGLYVGLSGGSGGSSDGSAPATRTAAVSERTLVDRESFDGTLGFDGARQVVNNANGTITRLPGEGEVKRRGGVLYRVDNQPVVLFSGATPMYRDLSTESANGPDVRQLELNLVTLGYDPDRDITIDGEFDEATEAAVERWQDDLGVEETGTVSKGSVVFQPAGARRVGTISVQLGATARPGQAVMQTTSLERAVTVRLDARRQDLVSLGSTQRVELPDGREVDATVSEVGTVASAAAEGADPTIPVTLTLDSTRGVTRLDEAPVTVEIARETRDGVLSVPVQALLALDGGGYGLEVRDGSGTRIVRTEVGLFADGYVEVEGAGIEPGTEVVMPA
jgi:peptidoglycan hydrolase-like protein with peptidoglycan-binding domain